jgi:hypothetical protein
MNLRVAAAEARKQRAAQQALAKCCVSFQHHGGAGTFTLKPFGGVLSGYAVLFSRLPVTAFMPLRFASAHRFFAAREILFLP